MRISDWSSDVCSADLDQVAHQRELAAAAEGEAVDRADDRLRDRMRGATAETPRLLLGIVGGEALAARQRNEVSAGAEALVARAGDDNHAAFGIVLRLLQRGAGPRTDRCVYTAACLAPVDRD